MPESLRTVCILWANGEFSYAIIKNLNIEEEYWTLLELQYGCGPSFDLALYKQVGEIKPSSVIFI